MSTHMHVFTVPLLQLATDRSTRCLRKQPVQESFSSSSKLAVEQAQHAHVQHIVLVRTINHKQPSKSTYRTWLPANPNAMSVALQQCDKTLLVQHRHHP